MPTFNQCQFIGRLGKDPEMSYTPNGKPVTKFSLAVDQGKGQETLWLNIVCWNELAERMNQYLQKAYWSLCKADWSCGPILTKPRRIG